MIWGPPSAVSLAALLSLSMACSPRSQDCRQVRAVAITDTVGVVPQDRLDLLADVVAELVDQFPVAGSCLPDLEIVRQADVDDPMGAASSWAGPGSSVRLGLDSAWSTAEVSHGYCHVIDHYAGRPSWERQSELAMVTLPSCPGCGGNLAARLGEGFAEACAGYATGTVQLRRIFQESCDDGLDPWLALVGDLAPPVGEDPWPVATATVEREEIAVVLDDRQSFSLSSAQAPVPWGDLIVVPGYLTDYQGAVIVVDPARRTGELWPLGSTVDWTSAQSLIASPDGPVLWDEDDGRAWRLLGPLQREEIAAPSGWKDADPWGKPMGVLEGEDWTLASFTFETGWGGRFHLDVVGADDVQRLLDEDGRSLFLDPMPFVAGPGATPSLRTSALLSTGSSLYMPATALSRSNDGWQIHGRLPRRWQATGMLPLPDGSWVFQILLSPSYDWDRKLMLVGNRDLTDFAVVEGICESYDDLPAPSTVVAVDDALWKVEYLAGAGLIFTAWHFDHPF